MAASRPNQIKYVGKAEYCYANAATMLLSSVGESIWPSLIEVLTGVGLGAFLAKNTNFLFFNNFAAWPDEGINRAFAILGFVFEEEFVKDRENPPFDKLSRILVKGPVILGPLDLGLLVYNPNHEYLSGTDHFVLAYRMDNEKVYLHDPYGFPNVFLTLDQLKEAWKAENILYRRDYYRFWHQPRRVRHPTENEIYRKAMASFIGLYKRSAQKAAKEGVLVGAEAIRTSGSRIKKGIARPDEILFLTSFALALASRRSLDFAEFFSKLNPDLAELKERQAQLFGESQTLASQEYWKQLNIVFEKLAVIEDGFSKQLLKLAKLAD